MSLSCREFVDFLMEYLDGELGEGERRVFEAHIGDCTPCGTYLETYRETVRLGRSVCRESADPATDPVPEDVPEELVRAILAARDSSS